MPSMLLYLHLQSISLSLCPRMLSSTQEHPLFTHEETGPLFLHL